MNASKKQKKAAKRTAPAIAAGDPIAAVARRIYAPEVQPKTAPSPAERAEMSRDVRTALDALTLQGLGSPASRALRSAPARSFPDIVRRSTADSSGRPTGYLAGLVTAEMPDPAPFICG